MKKFRILAIMLVILALSAFLFVACDKEDTPEEQECVEHEYGRRQIVSEVGCLTDRVEKRVCNVCGYEKIETTQKARGHMWETEPVFDNNATCTEDGTQSIRCRICDVRDPSAAPGSKLGHNFKYYTPIDAFTEKSVCLRCEKETHIRLSGLDIDFEGEKNSEFYTKLSVYTAGERDYRLDGENSYLAISRGAETVLGSTEFGVILTPRTDNIKGVSADDCPSYIVSFDIRLSKDNTKDLILLQGSKNGVKETFLTYNSDSQIIETTDGPVYGLTANDFDKWLNIAVCLNDGKKMYEVYIDGYRVTGSVAEGTAAVYSNTNAYFMGFDLEYLKICMASDDRVASSFDIDNIKVYVDDTPAGYEEGKVISQYAVFEAPKGDRITYRVPDSNCTHNFQQDKVVPAACGISGYTVNKCAACYGEEIVNIKAPKRHSLKKLDTGDEGKTQTCTKGAYTVSYCANCDYKQIKYLNSPLGHEIDPAHESYRKIEPTCVAEGYSMGKCLRCEYVFDRTEVVPALGHELNLETATVIEPTCTTAGYSVGKCVRCEYIFDKTMNINPVPATGHTINPDDPSYQVVPPTCTEAGYTIGKCLNCDHVYDEDDKLDRVPPTGHDIDETTGTCNNGCGYVVPEDEEEDEGEGE